MDRAGNSDAKGYEAEWTYDAAAARKAGKLPPAPEIILGRVNQGELRPGSRPLGVTEVNVIQPYTRVQATPDAPPWAPAGEKNSIEVIATGELPSMGFQMRGVRYDLQNWPYLDLDYKVPRETPFNLHLITEAGEYHALLLVDVEDARDERSGEIVSRFGPPADFVADGTWRQSTIPLRKLFADTNAGAEIPKLMGFSFHDNGWRGGRRGLHYWIHRVQPVPAGRPEDITVVVQRGRRDRHCSMWKASIDGAPNSGTDRQTTN